MCRYAFYKYKNTYACFKCQVGFKRRNLFDIDPDAKLGNEAKCPNCGGEMANLGRDLRLPAKTKDEEWRCIKYLVDNKYNIYSCGCQGIGFVPHKMEDAIELVAEYKKRDTIYQQKQELEAKRLAIEKQRKKNSDALVTKKKLREIKKEN